MERRVPDRYPQFRKSLRIPQCNPSNCQFFVSATRPDKVFLQSIVADGVEGKGRSLTVAA
jgi:transposase